MGNPKEKLNIIKLKEKIIAVGRSLRDQGLIIGGEGNLSLRLPDGNLLVTPARACKGKLSLSMLLVLDPKGYVIEGNLQPSSELLLHLHIYNQRKDVGGIVHAHPPFATGFSCAGISFSTPLLAESLIMLGRVQNVPFAMPGSIELVEALAPYLEENDCFLLSNHGVLTVGSDIETALMRMELIEQYAKILLITYVLGRQNPIPSKYLESLREMNKEIRFLKAPEEMIPLPKAPRVLLYELFDELLRRYLKK